MIAPSRRDSRDRGSRAKATHSQLRRHNQQLLLRAIYNGWADNRAALAQETGLAKPTVSELIGELIADGLLEETGIGGSSGIGGRPPRLLSFVPAARQVIGLSLSEERVIGVLARLDGQICAQHTLELAGARGDAVIDALFAVIAGLLAQRDAPLLCMGVGVAGLVDPERGIVRYAQHLGVRDLPLADILAAQVGVPVYIANDTELAAMAQYVYGSGEPVNCVAAVLIGSGLGVGAVIRGAVYHGGGDIGHVLVAERQAHAANGPVLSGREDRLETFLGWLHVQQRAYALQAIYPASVLPRAGEPLTYSIIRQAAAQGDPAALHLLDELSGYLAQVYAWIIAVMRPDHIALVGGITALGPPLLERAVTRVRQISLPNLAEHLTFSLAESPNTVAVGAVAQALQLELGLV